MGGRGAAGGAGKYAGDVRYKVAGGPGGGSVTAYQDKVIYGPVKSTVEVGSLTWGSDGKVHDIEVRGDRQRMGIGTAMWSRARQAAGGTLTHSPDRTDAGDRFARSVGGTVPARSDWRP